MSVSPFSWRRVAALVHPDARRSQIEQSQHEFFILSRIVTTIFAVALVPPYLYFTGAVALWPTFALVWVVFPLAAIAYVSRTGRLAEAQMISMFSLVLLALIIALAPGESRDVTLGWLMLIPLEAALSGSSMMLLFGSFLVVTTLLSLVGAQHAGLVGEGPTVSAVAATALAAPAAIYAALLAVGARHFNEARRRIELINSARYRALSEVIGDLVLRHDSSGAVLTVSNGAEALFNLEPQDLMGRGLFNRIHVADRPAYLKTIEAASLREETASATLRLLTGALEQSRGGYAEPVFAWAEIRIHQFARPAGPSDEATLVSVVRNVTAGKLAEARLVTARAEAEAASAWKARLLANVSHELRTPLNAILGFSEMLGNPDLAPREPAKQREYARIIHSSAEHLLSVVNLVLDMSRIEAGKFEILAEPFNVDQLIVSCLDMVRLKAAEGDVDLAVSTRGGAVDLVADKRACRQILLNLISNAIKFTPPGGKVAVGVRIVDGWCHFVVADTGIGIAEHDLPQVGDAFFQVRSAYDRTYEGAGLGLSLVRGLVGLHGGSILLESVAGEGTRVTVRLPLDCRDVEVLKGASPPLETATYFSSPADIPRLSEKKIA